MKNSNLDIWAIQDNKDEIYQALDHITNSQNNILFRNCICNFRIEDININVLFDTMFYCEDTDTLILIMRGGALSTKELESELRKRKIFYHQVVFNDNDFTYEPEKNIKPIWFAREKYVLVDAFQDSKDKGNSQCNYYPNVKGDLSMEYLTSTFTNEKIDGRDFKGLIETEDKLILLINQNDKRNLEIQGVFQVAESMGITTNVDMSRNVVSLKKSKQYIKE